jgi:aryl-alcohol dehydrogenase-like predicted oxidoreductase
LLNGFSMEYRRFGNTGLRVSAIGLGCARLGGLYTNDKEALATLYSAFDRGINFYDTADIYAQGRSERLLGEAFKHRRASVFIATKAGYRSMGPGRLCASLRRFLAPTIRLAAALGRQANRLHPVTQTQCFSAQYLRTAIEASLRRLQTDYLDIFQLHSPPCTVIETGEFIETLDQAKSQGKIKYYGVSCRTIADVRFCLLHPGISVVQAPINLLQFKNALSMLALAERKGVPVIARQPLASGLLSKPALRLKARHFAVTDSLTERINGLKALQFLELMNHRTMAQAALQFVLQLPGVSVAIAGMSTREHLDENLTGSTELLTQSELARICAALGEDSIEELQNR